jgi:hypothetical protein|tara:strand:- start:129 stop:344 length:216 start_codon:yes stop_codon:yes gene_type:complete
MNKTNRRGCGPYKKRRKDKAGSEDKQTNYLSGLSAMVNKACDEWLDKRGLKNKTWKQQQEENAKRKLGSRR